VDIPTESFLKSLDGFQNCVSLQKIVIPRAVETIKSHDFLNCSSLTEIEFVAGGLIRAIHGFQGCRSLRRFEVPPTVTFITGLNRCTSLVEVICGVDGKLDTISGCLKCPSLRRVVVSNSLTRGFPDSAVFSPGTPLRAVVYPVGYSGKFSIGGRRLPMFLVYEDDEKLKRSRRALAVRSFAPPPRRPSTVLARLNQLWKA
jgi:hypothetical protein